MEFNYRAIHEELGVTTYSWYATFNNGSARNLKATVLFKLIDGHDFVLDKATSTSILKAHSQTTVTDSAMIEATKFEKVERAEVVIDVN